MSIGPLEILIVVVIILLLFGAKRLPELGKSLGGGMREFGEGIKGEKREEVEAPPEEKGTEKKTDSSDASG